MTEEITQSNAWKAKFTDPDGEPFTFVFQATTDLNEIFEAIKKIDKELDLTEDGYTLDSLEYAGTYVSLVPISTQPKEEKKSD